MSVHPVTVDFDAISPEEYLKWINMAELLRERGYFTDISAEELAKKLYNKNACEG
jgi:hypothetical protein